ncbi:MAG TPA: hypothetical protein VGP24_13190 [Glaciihabitans sp.]|jgi:hypothetical protein|nr:hypothetical protein [Glaciihabitans sp.]
MTQHTSDDSLVPLISDTLIEDRVRTLIGRANMRQMWLLFLDEDELQLPLLIPIDGLPPAPDPSNTQTVISNIAELMGEIGATGLIIVWERYGPATLSAQDSAWATALAAACATVRVRLRAILLSHRSGVRWIGAEDYRL